MSKAKDPGLGSKHGSVSRMINEDGSYNIQRAGGMHTFRDLYKYLTEISWTTFFLWTISTYLLINIIFAGLYMIGGVEDISGINPKSNHFLNAFFFSVQTFTTVGYGFLAPVGAVAGIISTFEAFLGLLYFALITGLLYGRFSKPSSKIAFARNAILTDFEDGQAIMFKMVNQRNSVLLKASVKCTLAIDTVDDKRTFHNIDLQLDYIQFFPLTWTIVHKITEESPFHGLNAEQIRERHAELIVMVEAFDETFAQNVIEKRSFAGDQWIEGVKFKRNFALNSAGKIELHIDELDDVEPI
ncbi:MAG: ion channel [Crocinitomicaceae bacterium]|nr:ion channel [Crocinitomicaceae bacterium]